MARILIASLIALSLTSTSLRGGDIKGRVFDARTGKPLVGAVILIVDGDMGTKSIANGYFHIKRAPAGFHNLIAAFPDYRPQSIDSVFLRHESVVFLQFALRREIDVVDTGAFAIPLSRVGVIDPSVWNTPTPDSTRTKIR